MTRKADRAGHLIARGDPRIPVVQAEVGQLGTQISERGAARLLAALDLLDGEDPPGASPPVGTRVYTRTGQVAHVVTGDPNIGVLTCVRCGLRPPGSAGWRGAGSRTEYAKAARLPLCAPGRSGDG